MIRLDCPAELRQLRLAHFIFFLFTVILLCSHEVWALQWQIIGPRAIGMGGAYVAVVNDATGQYWNPGVYGLFHKREDPLEDRFNEDRFYDEEKEYIRNPYIYFDEQTSGMNRNEKLLKDKPKLKPTTKLWTGHSTRKYGLHFDVGVGYQLQDDLLTEVSDLQDTMEDVDFEDLVNRSSDGKLPVGRIPDVLELFSALDKINDSKLSAGMTFNSNLALRIYNFGYGVYVLSEFAGSANVDLDNLSFLGTKSLDTVLDRWVSELGLDPNGFVKPETRALTSEQESQTRATLGNTFTQEQADKFIAALDYSLAQKGYSKTSNNIPQDIFDSAVRFAASMVSGATSGFSANFDNNQSTITFIGATIYEIPLTLGYSFFHDRVSVGGNFKAMQGNVYYNKVSIFDIHSDNPFKKAYSNVSKSNNFGIDLGIIGRFPDLRLGLVARNINRPVFEIDKDSGYKHYAVDPQVRAGFAFVPSGWFTFAMDMDVTRNKTVSEGYYSQLLSAGMEFNVYNYFMLRIGSYSNIGDNTKHDRCILTAGVGMNFWLFRLDIGMAASTYREKYNDYSIPSEARAQGSLSIQF